MAVEDPAPNSWAAREAGRDAARARVLRLRAAMGRPYVRTRPRNPEEARLLRAKGVPERLIGPDRTDV